MTRTAAPRSPHPLSWASFIAMLLFTGYFVYGTAAELPARIAVHFDAAGDPNSFMASDQYRRFILLLAVAAPAALVLILTAAYTHSAKLKIPHAEYWLAPERAARTRAFLTAHGAWFGTLFAAMMCFTHRLVLTANRNQPPHLPNSTVYVGLVSFLIGTIAWVAVMMIVLRRPRGR